MDGTYLSIESSNLFCVTGCNFYGIGVCAAPSNLAFIIIILWSAISCERYIDIKSSINRLVKDKATPFDDFDRPNSVQLYDIYKTELMSCSH